MNLYTNNHCFGREPKCKPIYVELEAILYLYIIIQNCTFAKLWTQKYIGCHPFISVEI